MRFLWGLLAPLAVSLVLVVPSSASAQNESQIKPYFLLVFDTSTSMNQGTPTKLTNAKIAVANVINSTGDAVFGLERYYQAACTPATNNCPGLTSCGGTPNACTAGGEVVVGIEEDNQDRILVWVDNTCDFDTDQFELRLATGTPLAGSLQHARTYFESGIANLWSTEYRGAGNPWPSPIVQDRAAVPPLDQCRPYKVILLTDGQESCGGDPPARATELRSTTVGGVVYDVETYAIAFGINGPDDAMEDIALAGGTDNPGDGAGGLLAFYPQDDVDLALALSQIIQDSLLVEECNGVDDDCDTLIDEGVTNACGTCGALVEVCNAIDDDCDGQTDEGFPLFCNRPGGHAAEDLCADPGETVCNGVDDNCNGVVDEGNICAGCVPSAEICDGVDNDCDGPIDEGLVRACGTDIGECTAGNQTCVTGAWGACSGQGAVAELCNALDDDCNGVADGMVQPCGSDVGECQAGAQRCDAGAFGGCVGQVGPTGEICDGLDNDCDGTSDNGNPGGGAPCGSDQGECTAGVSACINGALGCTGVGPVAEICDTLDNDCDGLTDEGNPGGGLGCGLPDEGECSDGVTQCVGGSVECIGSSGPSEEICDDRDNDCDGLIDEDLGLGEDCGTDVGECVGGTFQCVDGEVVCDGGVGPVPEACNTLDDDCDGEADEGLGVGEPCGDDTGECEPGIGRCEDGQEICDGEVEPTDEICNGLDDDCDGETDEGFGLGDACGTELGLCEPGRNQCVDGDIVCAGGVPPQTEQCDCQDNDCDDLVDENPDEICPEGSRCVDCDCALPCGDDPEFPCPPGRECVDGYCVGDLCAGVHCEGASRCVRGVCQSPCDGISCPAGTRCDEGRCLADDCFNFPSDCGPDEDCVAGECASSPCADVSCTPGQYCRDGACVASCVGVECPGERVCVDGACVVDPCEDVSCDRGRFCDPATGSCADDQCDGVACGAGRFCDRASGDCVEDLCNVTECPGGQECVRGVCDIPGEHEDDVDAGLPDQHVLATGGGGCVCRAASPGGGSAAGGWCALALGLALLMRRRRTPLGPPFARSGSTLSMAGKLAPWILPLFLSGCEVEPYCLTCEDPVPGDDASVHDAGFIPRPDGGPLEDAGELDADLPDGCVVGAAERCNGRDDDCDGDIDEGIDFGSPAHCGSCENVCTFAHVLPSCEGGVCGIADCDVGFQDLDDDITNGCEYGSCLPISEDDATCDEIDDDCDGEPDEDVDLTVDPLNCGACGRRCTIYAHGVGACADGDCYLDDCEDGYVDANDDDGDGCETSCVPTGPELCDGADNDCVGGPDDGDPEGGAPCGSVVGECRRGTQHCQGGLLVCQDEVAPVDELCNGLDDDCDGETDEDNPEGGALCGTDEGDCVAGRETCVDGDLICVGEVGADVEVCDAHDNDCDGVIDQGNPGGGGACGGDVGACAFGTDACVGGVIVCTGGTGPRIELCNTQDDDCDGQTDEGFDTNVDIDNCGGCGSVCAPDNAFPVCTGGACDILACEVGWFDRNGDPSDGCELDCDFAGAEVCNGRDDDCNGLTDDALVAPANLCNPNGACAGTAATCGGATGWECNYGGAVDTDGNGDIVPELRCDNVDNDCDGFVDEHAPLKGTGCSNGTGECLRGGQYICNAADPLGPVVCNAPPAGAAGVESCNGLDDDCDGSTDEGIVDNMVQVTNNLWVFRYEASRPDALVDDAGTDGSRACSTSGVLPWTDATWDEANDACAAAGKRLCSAAEWQDACESVSNTCDWSYDGTAGFACTTYANNTCNGNNYDFDANTAGDQDGLLPTAALTHCGSDQLAGAGLSLIYDMSGNAKEWTSTDPAGGSVEYLLLGGAYNNPAGGLRCDFLFTVGEPDFHFPNVGFRCCSGNAP